MHGVDSPSRLVEAAYSTSQGEFQDPASVSNRLLRQRNSMDELFGREVGYQSSRLSQPRSSTAVASICKPPVGQESALHSGTHSQQVTPEQVVPETSSAALDSNPLHMPSTTPSSASMSRTASCKFPVPTMSPLFQGNHEAGLPSLLYLHRA